MAFGMCNENKFEESRIHNAIYHLDEALNKKQKEEALEQLAILYEKVNKFADRVQKARREINKSCKNFPLKPIKIEEPSMVINMEYSMGGAVQSLQIKSYSAYRATKNINKEMKKDDYFIPLNEQQTHDLKSAKFLLYESEKLANAILDSSEKAKAEKEGR